MFAFMRFVCLLLMEEAIKGRGLNGGSVVLEELVFLFFWGVAFSEK